MKTFADLAGKFSEMNLLHLLDKGKKAFKNKGLLYLVDNHPNDTQYIGENVGSKDVLVKNTGIIF